MKKGLSALIISITLVLFFLPRTVLGFGPTQDSNELRLQDMLILILTPYIEKDLTNYYYPKIFKDVSPRVTPWKIELIETKRNHFRGFDLQITFEIEPTDGGHNISLGKDRMTYEISFGPEVKLINHTHLKTYKYPPE
ncbi:DUF3888 domain-containing protein [Lysinibacillus pakistanensis]|uniref:DUF3888 domain-containing protein n=1 Tax=Lysinibacillus pakistanensis TaxID=759811 RepID=A0AAX3X4V9_9BACI|nr:DUF3888 domain-containing protein [Lysinibacillus pakistanensis]MDM5233422.1 DUF3888 domain-containing protein [Lysinibacillus pakistanensis]WHY48895.1 DUF3888 domain-containing protein [Lysinibacillus pakistanensis]WHY53906.1 DUF3888 domain-containing protein [Lysinibacillus pakistanensis]